MGAAALPTHQKILSVCIIVREIHVSLGKEKKKQNTAKPPRFYGFCILLNAQLMAGIYDGSR